MIPQILQCFGLVVSNCLLSLPKVEILAFRWPRQQLTLLVPPVTVAISNPRLLFSVVVSQDELTRIRGAVGEIITTSRA
jgi:hypothetical protein